MVNIEPLTIKNISITQKNWHEMYNHVDALKDQEEACGIIAGRAGISQRIFPVVNILHSTSRFSMEPNELLHALIEIEKNEMDILAIYHSHPAGPIYPSFIDIIETTYPNAFILIWSLKRLKWICSGYIIRNNSYQPIPILLKP